MLCRCTAVVPPVAVCSHCRRSQTLSPVTPQQLSLEGPPRTALDERAGYRLVNAHEGFKSRAGAYTLLNLHSLFLVVRRAATADPASYIPIPLCQSNCWPPLTQHYGVADRATRNKPQRAIGQTKKKAHSLQVLVLLHASERQHPKPQHTCFQAGPGSTGKAFFCRLGSDKERTKVGTPAVRKCCAHCARCLVLLGHLDKPKRGQEGAAEGQLPLQHMPQTCKESW